MSAFNPYREWLGIQAKGSVTYYQLLGAKRQDSASVIRKRATRVIRRLQKVDPGKHADERDRLISRVRRAAKCLSSATERKKYDLRLEQQREKQAAAASKASQRPQPAPGRKSSSKREKTNNKSTTHKQSTEETAPSQSAQKSRKSREPQRSDSSQPATKHTPDRATQSSGGEPRNVTDELMRLRPRRRDIAPAYKANHRRSRAMKISLTLFVISLLGIGFLILQQSGWGDRLMSSTSVNSPPATSGSQADRPGSASSNSSGNTAATNTSANPTGGTDAGSPTADGTRNEPTRVDSMPSSQRNDSPRPSTGEVTVAASTTSTGGVNSESNKKLLSLLQSAKRSLGQRKIATAKAAIEEARVYAADALDRAMLERLSTVAGYVQTYWQATDSQLATFKSGNEAVIGGRRVMIVEKTDRRLIIRSAGKNQTIDLQNLSTKQAAKLADSWLDETVDSTKVFRGAMMAVTPGYEPEEARRLWREAEAGGEIHLGDLEQVLDDKYE